MLGPVHERILRRGRALRRPRAANTLAEQHPRATSRSPRNTLAPQWPLRGSRLVTSNSRAAPERGSRSAGRKVGNSKLRKVGRSKGLRVGSPAGRKVKRSKRQEVGKSKRRKVEWSTGREGDWSEDRYPLRIPLGALRLFVSPSLRLCTSARAHLAGARIPRANRPRAKRPRAAAWSKRRHAGRAAKLYPEPGFNRRKADLARAWIGA